MTYTLSNLLFDAIDDGLGKMTVVTATGGSTTTGQDSNANGVYGDDTDALQNGTLFVRRDAGGAGAAPEGQFQRISAYDGTTITVDTAFTAAIAAGDTLGIANPSFPIRKCIESANRAVQGFGRIPLVDTSTITPAVNTTEYTWAIDWKYSRPFRIDIQGRTGVSTDNQWYKISDYEVQPALPGSAGKIIFNQYLPVGNLIRVWYWGIHPTLNAYNDPVNEAIHPTLARAALTELLAGWYYKQSEGEPIWREIWNNAKNDLVNAREMYPIGYMPDEPPTTFSFSNGRRGDFPPSPIAWTEQ